MPVIIVVDTEYLCKLHDNNIPHFLRTVREAIIHKDTSENHARLNKLNVPHVVKTVTKEYLSRYI